MGKIKLYNGLEIPDLCFGTGIVYDYRYGECNIKRKAKYWIKNMMLNRKKFKSDFNFKSNVEYAMSLGCRMFDTARAYGGSEYALGQALNQYNRDDYFVVTKLSNYDQYESNVEKSLDKSLKELNMEYVDLYLMHWPVKDLYIKNWNEIVKMYEKGKCKAIGVSNFDINHIEALKQNTDCLPMVNEFECHPLFTQNELRDYCNNNNIKIMAYTSTARMDERLRKTVLYPISQKYNKSMAQVILKWHQQIGNIPIVNSSDKKHLGENIYDFELTENEIKDILKININSRLRYDPNNCDFRQL